MECPKEFIDRANVLYNKSFMGFPVIKYHGDINLKLCTSSKIKLDHLISIVELSNAKTLTLVDNTILISWTEYSKISNVFNALLLINHSFVTCNKGMIVFCSSKDDQFTFELMETKIINNLKYLLKINRKNIYNNNVIPNEYFKIWNYSTSEGITFCQYLRRKRKFSVGTINHKDNYFKSDLFKNYNPDTLLNLDFSFDNISTPRQEENNDECIVCMDKSSQVLTNPCQHKIICEECFYKSLDTNNHGKCILCRQAISNILIF